LAAFDGNAFLSYFRDRCLLKLHLAANPRVPIEPRRPRLPHGACQILRYQHERTDFHFAAQPERNFVLPQSKTDPFRSGAHENRRQHQAVFGWKETWGADVDLLGTRPTVAGGTSGGRGRPLSSLGGGLPHRRSQAQPALRRQSGRR
jgi:hypothetical protein